MTCLRRFKSIVALALFVLLALVWLPESSAQKKRKGPRGPIAPAASSNTRARPRLVLLIIVDQFRYDYLERFGDLFVANGLKRLLRDGASWTQSNYDHMPT